MMARNRKTDRGLQSFGAVTGWFVLALILVFAGLSIALIALGAQAYKAVAQTAADHAHRRASIGYAVSRVQAFDAAGAILVREENVDGTVTDVLVFHEEIEGEAYETRLYCAAGMLCEQFVLSGTPLSTADDGEAIADLAAFEAELDGVMLTMRFEHPDGSSDTMRAAIHSAREAER